MKDHQDLRRLLREAIPPLSRPELETDLWPRMLRRLDEHAAPSLVDWLVAAGAVGWSALIPGLLPALFRMF